MNEELVQKVVKAMQEVWGDAADDDSPPLGQLARAAIIAVWLYQSEKIGIYMQES